MDPFGAEPIRQETSSVAVRSDADARRAVEHARRSGLDIPAFELLDGDLYRSVANNPTSDELDGHVDVVSVLLDGRPHWFVAHLVARQPSWKGRVIGVLNTPWVGGRAAPGVDPTDGRLEVFDGVLRPGERRSLRAGRGSDRPWPKRDGRWGQVSSIDIELGRPTSIWLDGEEAGKAWYLSIQVEHRAARYRMDAAS
ncbi:MAG: hypothetical protein KDA97_02190 [Acidimicrobiales bacterium]|nr:hypothetical protein [Acidimicrobiales bacterium]